MKLSVENSAVPLDGYLEKKSGRTASPHRATTVRTHVRLFVVRRLIDRDRRAEGPFSFLTIPLRDLPAAGLAALKGIE